MNKVNRLVNDEKKNSTAEEVKKGLNIYKIYRSTIGTKDSVIYPTDAQNKVAAMNQFFASIGGSFSLSLPRNSKNFFSERNVNSVVFPPVTESEVQKYIDNMKNKTSCGFDEISNRFLKIVSHVIVPYLVTLINESFILGIFPSCLKTAKVIPIFKEGDKIDFGNYRPISLLSALSKIIERAIHARIVNFFDKNTCGTQCNMVSGAKEEQ